MAAPTMLVEFVLNALRQQYGDRDISKKQLNTIMQKSEELAELYKALPKPKPEDPPKEGYG